ncbi:L,D-transpeptidase [Solirubrobacter ginsenosidimutans]|uniref:L,D-transpeptidase n=1 Tax=Solirubrobacter ginsenosidimutans TaxID=490573 RepID=A0A9X3S365_9ACTN|nr:L,D-transpeptidase [Solirubrobacter ginsenosidimutans]MDA0164294.1 L,D-transpeptidase [Solirubrobacter ginsenosidimutans]
MLAAVGVLLGAAPAQTACPDVPAPTRARAWRAELLGNTPARTRLTRTATVQIGPRAAGALLVLGPARLLDGRCWVRVRLASRPNDAAAWVETRRVQLRATRWRIEVRRARREVRVRRDGRIVRRFRVVVGAPSTPTPRGLFAIATATRGAPNDFYGAWVVSLTAHSDVLQRYDGGDGRVALHGRGGASLRDPLGSARSHGCVRLDNAAIGWLVRRIGSARLAGTPVEVR